MLEIAVIGLIENVAIEFEVSPPITMELLPSSIVCYIGSNDIGR